VPLGAGPNTARAPAAAVAVYNACGVTESIARATRRRPAGSPVNGLTSTVPRTIAATLGWTPASNRLPND
jgi:hypothetical protein